MLLMLYGRVRLKLTRRPDIDRRRRITDIYCPHIGICYCHCYRHISIHHYQGVLYANPTISRRANTLKKEEEKFVLFLPPLYFFDHKNIVFVVRKMEG